MKQKIFIKTFGCQMNEYDSNRIYDSLKKIGYEKTENYEDANYYLLNTCHIRDKAKEKVYHEIGRAKKIFRSKKKPLVIIAGCVAQAENQEMLKREPYIDLVIGPQAYHKINDTILNHIEKNKKAEETEFDAISKFEYFNKIKNNSGKISSFLTASLTASLSVCLFETPLCCEAVHLLCCLFCSFGSFGPGTGTWYQVPGTACTGIKCINSYRM